METKGATLIKPLVEAQKIMDTKNTLLKVKTFVQIHWIPKSFVSSKKLIKQTMSLAAPPKLMVLELHNSSPFAPTLVTIPKFFSPSQPSSNCLTQAPH